MEAFKACNYLLNEDEEMLLNRLAALEDEDPGKVLGRIIHDAADAEKINTIDKVTGEYMTLLDIVTENAAKQYNINCEESAEPLFDALVKAGNARELRKIIRAAKYTAKYESQDVFRDEAAEAEKALTEMLLKNAAEAAGNVPF